MNDVISEDERNMQSALLDSEVLQAIDLLRVGDKQERAHLALENPLVGRDALLLVERDLAHLAYLLLKCHLPQQFVHKTICLRAVLADLLRLRPHRNARGRTSKASDKLPMASCRIKAREFKTKDIRSSVSRLFSRRERWENTS